MVSQYEAVIINVRRWEVTMWKVFVIVLALGFIASTGCRSRPPHTGGAAAVRENGSLDRTDNDGRGITGRALKPGEF